MLRKNLGILPLLVARQVVFKNILDFTGAIREQ